jgi:hypothetical protein
MLVLAELFSGFGFVLEELFSFLDLDLILGMAFTAATHTYIYVSVG